MKSGKEKKPERLTWLSSRSYHAAWPEGVLDGGHSSFNPTVVILLQVSLGPGWKSFLHYTALLLSFLLIVSLAFHPFDTLKQEALYFENVLATRKKYIGSYMALGILICTSVSCESDYYELATKPNQIKLLTLKPKAILAVSKGDDHTKVVVGPHFWYSVSSSLTPSECYGKSLPPQGSSFPDSLVESLLWSHWRGFGFRKSGETGSWYFPGRSHGKNPHQMYFCKDRSIGKSKRLTLQSKVSKMMFSLTHSTHVCRWTIYFLRSLVTDS